MSSPQDGSSSQSPPTDPSRPQPSPSNPSIPDETGYYPYSKWRNFFGILLKTMPDEGRKKWRRERDLANETEDCKRCEENVEWVLENSPIVRFMQGNIYKLGGEFGKKQINCMRCEEYARGGFDPRYGMTLCANIDIDKKRVEDTVAHEMVHAWDHLRFKVDWNHLHHAACTEIRASSLSGECRFLREFWTRSQWKITEQHQECVRRRAILSVYARPTCKSMAQATSVVNEVWDGCFRDTRPFDEIYK